MSVGLPERIDLLRAARNGVRLQGEIAVRRLPRFGQYLALNEGQVQVDLQCAVDMHHRPTVTGTARAKVQLQCQRCLQPMDQALESNIQLGIVRSEEEARHLPDDLDPLLLEGEDPVSLWELVEDELILSLPIVQMHDPAACPASRHLQPDTDKEALPEAENPFSVLKNLKL